MLRNSIQAPDPMQEEVHERVKDFVRDKVEEKLGIERTPAQKEAERKLRNWRKRLRVY